ncbi:MAG: adenosylhomocysteinase [Dehalococcoidales bacterium]|nr:adenosylhomocysteinase [Dehalococcoidales bacterium]MDD3264499.1 adenosylhomocysteinase [Dehalococcoidales bacterium]MDD4322030.1 adenosylhomocysteinase [Dehalococcoidales bacterium]MDD4793877.1 adenosylhomocysteinase [Dehalococcoidales bacterium]MDD5498009.1 adenosylhomocysteinase [Dehalococcoidales bacterium]
MADYEIKDIALAETGRERINWAGREMPVLKLIGERFDKEKPFEGIRIAACLHVTTETANLALVLKKGGAEVSLCASNPLSTQDDVCAALVENGMAVNAIHGADDKSYYRHINKTIDIKPHLTVDDGADLVTTLHTTRTELVSEVLGGTEETTTGVIRLRSLAAEGRLKYPIVAVNDALTKHLFDNRYGTGQSTIDGITRSTNILWAGKTVVVGGYGWCGRGIAMRARGMGSQVVVIETEPLRALEAVMDGYRVMPAMEAARIGDVFITATGDKHVLTGKHFEIMKNGAMLANSGHFNVEIDIPALKNMSTGSKNIRQIIDEHTLADGRKIYLLGEGRLINLAGAEGHPASVMDMSFANQALSLEYLVKNQGLATGVYPVPADIDRSVASLKLEALGVKIDSLTPQQHKYLQSWQEGT